MLYGNSVSIIVCLTDMFCFFTTIGSLVGLTTCTVLLCTVHNCGAGQPVLVPGAGSTSTTVSFLWGTLMVKF